MIDMSIGLLKEVWEKAQEVPGYDPEKIRKDACGAWITFERFDDRNSSFGWEIDHIFPGSVLAEKGVYGTKVDDIRNLRPLHWANHDAKGDNFPAYVSVVTSVEDKNKIIETPVEINFELQKELRRFFEL